MKTVGTVVSVAAFSLAACSAAAETVQVPFWTAVPVRFTQTINSRSAMPGQMVATEVAEDVVVNDRIVLHRGMPVWADVVDVKKRGSFGVPGHVDVIVRFARDGRNSLRLAGRVGSKGSEGGAGLVAASVLLGLPGAIAVTGRNGDIPAGTTLLAHVDEIRTVDVPGTRSAALGTMGQSAPGL